MTDPRVGLATSALLEGVGAEIASAFPGITRLGGQIVAALYLADRPRSLDELSELLGRSKSNVFTNAKGLESLGIVQRRREPGARHDVYALKGGYPDVIVGAYVSRLRSVVADKRVLARQALATLGDAEGPEADRLRARLAEVLRKYDLFATFMAGLPELDGPLDLERLLSALPPDLLATLQRAATSAWDR